MPHRRPVQQRHVPHHHPTPPTPPLHPLKPPHHTPYTPYTPYIRCHIVDQFNRGMYDIIIAADEKALHDSKEAKKNSYKKSKSVFSVQVYIVDICDLINAKTIRL